MESANCAYPAPAAIFDELPWMPMPPAAYYAYPVSASGQSGYPMTMQHSLPYSNMANWYGYNTTSMQSGGKYKKKRNLFTKLQLNMLQRRFAEREHIRQPERDNFAQMIGLTGEQVKIWFQNQRYKRKHRMNGNRNEGANGSSGANTSISSLSSPSPRDSPDVENARPNDTEQHENSHMPIIPSETHPTHKAQMKYAATPIPRTGIQDLPLMHQNGTTVPLSNITFQQTQNYSQVYWGSQVAYYPTPPTFPSQNFNNSDEKISLSSSSENDLDL